MEGLPALEFREMVLDLFCPLKPTQLPLEKEQQIENIDDALAEVDYGPPNVQAPDGRACLILLKDNDAVTQICIKGRNPMLRHFPRVHRVNSEA